MIDFIRPPEDGETPLSEAEMWVAIREEFQPVRDLAREVAEAMGDFSWG